MASEVRNFGVTVPANTTKAAPQVTPLTMPARIVRHVRVRIPPGPAGQVGFALASGGVPILPWGTDQWMVGDDESIEWPLEGQLESGAWQLRAYNLGVFDHTLYVTFQLDPLTVAGSRTFLAGPLDLGSGPLEAGPAPALE